MDILITGIAGFTGCKIAQYCKEHFTNINIIGIDNLSRRGSETNLPLLERLGCNFIKGDIRDNATIEALPKVGWIIDCAAEPSVLAGLQGGTLDLINNNLTGTFHLLEKCKRDNAGFILLSTSRVYSIDTLTKVNLNETSMHYALSEIQFLEGISVKGIKENFSTQAPISLYGATKLASEILALEYHYSFGFPVFINRCGVIAGAGQFGKIDQGIFSFWIYQYLLKGPLSFIGFNGTGKQVRDMLHPADVFALLYQQIQHPDKEAPKIINIGGGITNAFSLKELDMYCKEHIDVKKVINQVSETRKFDIPLYITDYSLAQEHWNWQPTIDSRMILQEILDFGSTNLELIKSFS